MNYFLFLCSMVFTVASLWLIKWRLMVFLSGGRAVGQVVGHEERHIDDSFSFHPVFAFLDHAGVQRRITSKAGWSAPRPPIGTKVQIRYHRQNPELAYIDTFYQLWFWPLVLAGFAAALMFAIWL